MPSVRAIVPLFLLAGSSVDATPLFEPPADVALAVFEDDTAHRCTLRRVTLDGTSTEILKLPGSCARWAQAEWSPDGTRFALEMECPEGSCTVFVDRLRGMTVTLDAPLLYGGRVGGFLEDGSYHRLGHPVLQPPGRFSRLSETLGGAQPRCMNGMSVALDTTFKDGAWQTTESISTDCDRTSDLGELRNWKALELGPERDVRDAALSATGSGNDYIPKATGVSAWPVLFLPTTRGFVTFQAYGNDFGFFDESGSLLRVLHGTPQQGCLAVTDSLTEWAGHFLYRTGGQLGFPGGVVKVLGPDGGERLVLTTGKVTFWPTAALPRSRPVAPAGSAAEHFVGIRYGANRPR